MREIIESATADGRCQKAILSGTLIPCHVDSTGLLSFFATLYFHSIQLLLVTYRVASSFSFDVCLRVALLEL